MHPREESTAVEFDVDIAIKVLRQSGYPDLAASLAEKHAGSSGGFHCTLGGASFDKQLHSHCVIFPIIITGKVA